MNSIAIAKNNPCEVKVFEKLINIEAIKNVRLKNALQRLHITKNAGYTEHSDHAEHSRYSACPFGIIA